MRSKNSSNKSRKHYKQYGGDGQGSRGHGYSFPIQYFGGKLNRYFPAGSPQLVPKRNAYGETIATSFGKNVPSLYAKNMVGPNLAPFPDSSGIQTGGKRSLKKRKSTKGGSIVKDVLSEAGNLAVPAGLYAIKKYMSKRKKKGGKRIQKRKLSKGGSVVKDVLSQASNLAVPAGLYAIKKYMSKKKKKGGKRR